MWRRIALGLIFAAALAASLPAPRAAAVTPTIIVSAPAPIIAFDANDHYLAYWRHWTGSPAHPTCGKIRRRTWQSGAVLTLDACPAIDFADDWLSLAGPRAYWLWSVPGGISCCDLTLTYQLFSSSPIAKQAEIVYSFHCGGETLGPLAAGGTVAAFGTRVWTSVVQCDETFHRGGHDTVTGGGVSLIAATGAPVALVGAPSPAMLAVAQGRIEVVPLDVTAGTLDALPPPLPEIQQWSVADGTLVRTIPESGTIRAIAVTKGVAVVLVDDGSGNLRLDRFSTASGAALGSTPVLASTAPKIAARGRWAAYLTDRTIRLLDLSNGHTMALFTPTYRPFQIAIGHGRVIWSSRPTLSSGRIASVPLPVSPG
jgi:hypothetical protein